ncbi:hypothetical protein [Niveibacterium sp.]|uniref:hypothetical protein n=1 Tax=Niveibacterium sp. TaxID=2017444 RepID=UPI0035B39C95
MFSDADREFMSKDMQFVVESIESKLNEPSLAQFREVALGAISEFIRAIKEFEASGAPRNLMSVLGNPAERAIDGHFEKITVGLDTADDAYQVLDALRYAFSGYAYNGLHQLYTRQQNECWHPKMRLTVVLEPNDIAMLAETPTLYRGCDRRELETRSFGQAWTTSLESAIEFAFHHYRHQDWFDPKSRVVLETSYAREHVLYAEQSNECEVVVDVDKLGSVIEHF